MDITKNPVLPGNFYTIKALHLPYAESYLLNDCYTYSFSLRSNFKGDIMP